MNSSNNGSRDSRLEFFSFNTHVNEEYQESLKGAKFSYRAYLNFIEKVKSDNENIYANFKKFLQSNPDESEFQQLKVVFDYYYKLVIQIVNSNFSENPEIRKHNQKILQAFYFQFQKFEYLLDNNHRTQQEYAVVFDSMQIIFLGLEEIVKEYDFISLIERNIKHKVFKIHGQGIFSVIPGPVESGKRATVERKETEVLTRMTDSDGQSLSPDRFMDVINEMTKYDPNAIKNFGRIEGFDEAVMEKAFQYIASLLQNNPNSTESFSININPISLYDTERFIKNLTDLLTRYKIPPHLLIIEILEYAKIENWEQVNETLKIIHSLGLKIAIDDYPEGYNTLRQITHLDYFDIVKLDGVYVMRTFKSCVDCEDKVSCLTTLDSTLDIDSICIKRLDERTNLETLIISLKFLKLLYPHIKIFAERIENASVFEFLQLTGLVDAYQGYEFEKPRILNRDEDEISEERKLELLFNGVKNDILLSDEEVENLRDLDCIEFLDLITRNPEELVDIRELQIERIKSFLEYSGFDTLRLFWRTNREDNFILVKEIKKEEGELSPTAFDATAYNNRVPKKLINFYKLLKNKDCFRVGPLNISEYGVAEEGDDIAIEVSPELYVAFDVSDSHAIDFSDKQYVLMFELCKILQKQFKPFH